MPHRHWRSLCSVNPFVELACIPPVHDKRSITRPPWVLPSFGQRIYMPTH